MTGLGDGPGRALSAARGGSPAGSSAAASGSAGAGVMGFDISTTTAWGNEGVRIRRFGVGVGREGPSEVTFSRAFQELAEAGRPAGRPAVRIKEGETDQLGGFRGRPRPWKPESSRRPRKRRGGRPKRKRGRPRQGQERPKERSRLAVCVR